MTLLRPGSMRALSRGMAGRRGRSIRMQARVWAILILLAIFVLMMCAGE